MDMPSASSASSKIMNGVNPSSKDAAPSAEKKLSGAELKKLKQAEKVARRQHAKAQKDVQDPSAQNQQQQPNKAQKNQQQSKPSASKPQPLPPGPQNKTGQQGWKRRPSAGAGAMQSPAKQGAAFPAKQAVALFGNLSETRRHTVAGSSKEVHPAVLALGLQMSSYEVCGSTARCVAMLLAFKSVIESYVTPPGTSLARHLTNHHLSPQIEYLKSCRPLSVSMGNAIRALKDTIIKIDPSVPEDEAKKLLLESIDLFIQERVTAADALISSSASQKIGDGDVVLTFAKSSLVLQTLLKAWEAGTKFRVIVVDSKPLFEGKRLAADLAMAGISVQYCLISAASHAIKEASKVFLGAHAMMSNGMLLSRCGTAVVAMLAHERDLPVIVCCESVKFTERVALDANGNEVAPSEELLSEEFDGLGMNDKDAAKRRLETVNAWRDAPNLYQVNPMFDLTDRSYIKMVVTEYGSLPPSSVPAVLRILETAKGGA